MQFLIEETLNAKAMWKNSHWTENCICCHQCESDKNHL